MRSPPQTDRRRCQHPRRCAEAFIDSLAIEDARHVVELGAGTGVITSALRHRLPSTALLLSVEISSALATQRRTRRQRRSGLRLRSRADHHSQRPPNHRRRLRYQLTSMDTYAHRGSASNPAQHFRRTRRHRMLQPPAGRQPHLDHSWPTFRRPTPRALFPTSEKNGHTGRIYHRCALITAEPRQ